LTPVTALESALHSAREAAAAERWEDACEILRRARSRPDLAASPELIEFMVFCLQSQARAQPEMDTSLLAEALLADPNNAELRRELDAAKAGRLPPSGVTGDWRQFVKLASVTTAVVLGLLLIRTLFTVSQANRRFSQVPNPTPVATEAPVNPSGQSQPPARGGRIFGFVVLTVVLTAAASVVLLKLTKKSPERNSSIRRAVTGE
jgi:hypothetical protein